MKFKDFLQLLEHRIPEEVACWQNEKYGFSNSEFVTPPAEVRKVLYCVTSSPEIEEYAIDNDYDAIVAHHPMESCDHLPELIFHTALDCCEGGLNDIWRDHLGVQDAKHFQGTLGWYGKIKPMSFDDLVAKVSKLSRSVDGQAYIADKAKPISSVVICTGMGGSVVDDARKTGADCYILGENTMPARKTGFSALIETGHTNSEWVGVLSLRNFLKGTGVTVDLAPEDLDYFGREYYG